jgi:ribosomal protein S30
MSKPLTTQTQTQTENLKQKEYIFNYFPRLKNSKNLQKSN